MELDNLPIDSNSISQFIKENGLNNLAEFTQNQLNQWKNCTLNIAITGNSGAGKSTLINTIRSLRAYDNGAAAVNVIQCTTEPTPYIHPENENLKLWDLPGRDFLTRFFFLTEKIFWFTGVGTDQFPQETYIQKMNFDQYDFFLIVTKTRFSANDAWLAQEITRMNKGFFFIRTQIDVDIQNTKDDQSNSFDEQTLLTRIRNDCLTNFNEISPSIYLISGLLTHNYLWDFPRLITDLITNFPIIKRQAFLLTMSPISTEIIRAKITELKKRVWLVATASATVAIIPVPFVSIGFDLTACIQEITVYRKQLGLTEQALRQLSERHKIPYEQFSIAFNDRIPIQMVTDIGKFVLSSARSIALSLGTQQTSRFVPIVGTAIASAASFGSTMYILNSILNDMEQVALQIQKIVFEYSSNLN